MKMYCARLNHETPIIEVDFRGRIQALERRIADSLKGKGTTMKFRAKVVEIEAFQIRQPH